MLCAQQHFIDEVGNQEFGLCCSKAIATLLLLLKSIENSVGNSFGKLSKVIGFIFGLMAEETIMQVLSSGKVQVRSHRLCQFFSLTQKGQISSQLNKLFLPVSILSFKSLLFSLILGESILCLLLELFSRVTFHIFSQISTVRYQPPSLLAPHYSWSLRSISWGLEFPSLLWPDFHSWQQTSIRVPHLSTAEHSINFAEKYKLV